MSCLASGRAGSYKVTSPTSPGVPASGPRHRQRPISFEGRFANTGLQCRNCRGLKPTRRGNCSHGPLHHAETLPALFHHGFRPPIFRIKRCKGDGYYCGSAVVDVMRFRRGEECQVNRILVGLLRSQGAREQHVGFLCILQRDHTGDRQLVHRNRTRLIHAEHVHRRGILRGAEARDQHTSLCQLRRPNGHADGEHDRESHGNRTHQQDKHQWDHLEERRAADE